MTARVPAPAYQRQIDALNADLDALLRERENLLDRAEALGAEIRAKRAERAEVYATCPRVERQS